MNTYIKSHAQFIRVSLISKSSKGDQNSKIPIDLDQTFKKIKKKSKKNVHGQYAILNLNDKKKMTYGARYF